MSDTFVVRTATRDDEKDILKLCELLAEENAVFPMSEAKVRQKLNQAFDKQLAMCGVIGPRGSLRGSIFLEVGTLWYTDTFGLHELWNFVHPDHRHSNYAHMLIDFAKECSTKLKLPLHIGVFSNKRTNAKVRLYKRRLGKPAGAFFLYNGQTGTT